MKNFKISRLFSILMAVALFISPVAQGIHFITDLPPALCFASAVGVHYVVEQKLNVWFQVNKIPNVYQAAVTKEIWVNDIVESLFKDNAFLNYAINDDDYVLEGKVVHVPQAASPSSVVKNRSSLPATVAKRTDTDVTYTLDEYTTDPRLIPNADTVELSYSKRDSVIREDKSAISETVADNIILQWAPTAATTIRTSGTPTAARMSGQTGNRNAFIEADLRKAMTVFNAQGVPAQGRYCLVDAYMYDDLVTSFTQSQYKDFSKYYDLAKGVLGQIHTFNVMMRPTVLVYNAAATTANAYGAAVAATDQCAALCWHERSVRRGIGEKKMFDQQDAPQYYGDIYSFLLRAAGRINRNDGKGILAISQQ